MYFAYLGHYTAALCVPAFIGFLIWFIQGENEVCILRVKVDHPSKIVTEEKMRYVFKMYVGQTLMTATEEILIFTEEKVKYVSRMFTFADCY